MPNDRTTLTELITGLGMLGHGDLTAAIGARPSQMVDVPPSLWDRIETLAEGEIYAAEITKAYANGEAFLAANDGLRGRIPVSIEWKGSTRAPGDEVAPIDLRVDHVFLVSCKYLSKILGNFSPSHLFDDLLTGPHGVRRTNWHSEIASGELADFYNALRSHFDFPPNADDLTKEHREQLRGKVPPEAKSSYDRFNAAVAGRSADRWKEALGHHRGERDVMLWRLLRLGATPYFVLGTAAQSSIRIRVATAWDWRAAFSLKSFDTWPQPGGQAIVGWKAVVESRHRRETFDVTGHVEIRWSHGKFNGSPEAKVYLDTPHAAVPGYWPLT